MPSHVLKNPFFSIDGVNLTGYIREIVLSYETELVEETASGDGTRTRISGLEDWAISGTLKQDYDSTTVEPTLWRLRNSSTFPVVVRPTTTGVGSGNPQYSGTGAMESFNLVNGNIGDLHETPVSILGNGVLSRSTST